MKKIAPGVISLAIAGPAIAADLPRRNVAPVLPPPVAFSWSGFYVGLNAGYGFGDDSTAVQQQAFYNLNSLDDQGIAYGGPSFRNRSNLNGVIGGGQIGYNIQVTPLVVFGVEADIQGSGLRGSRFNNQLTSMQFFPQPFGGAFFPLLASANTTQSVDWFGTVRGRVGFTPFAPSVLLYGTAGLAYGSVRQSLGYNAFYLPSADLGFVGSYAGGVAARSSTRLGYSAGAGVEWAPAFMPNFSLKVEYLYTDLGSNVLSAIGNGSRLDGQPGRLVSATSTSATRFNTVRAGINYRFNAGPAPVIARY